MMHFVCSVRDIKADSFGRPFFTPALGVATRSFLDEINRDTPDNLLFSHPGDFALYHLGVFDDQDASFALLPQPALLLQGDQARSTLKSVK